MNRTWKRTVVTGAVFVSMLWTAAASAQQLGNVPPEMRFIGTLAAPTGEKDVGGFHSLIVHIEGKELIFKVTQVYDTTGAQNGWLIFSYIAPPELYLKGPSALLDPLTKDDALGKPLAITGRLYVSSRVLMVDRVKDAKK